MTSAHQSINDYIGEPSSILLLAPSHTTPDDSACIDLLTNESPSETNVLSVTLSASPTDRLSVWQREAGDDLPTRAMIIDGRREMTKSELPASESGPVSVRGVSKHADLDDIGLAIASQLGEWNTTDESSVMCVHSVSTLLATYDDERVLSLITGLNELCKRLGVVAHHHVDSKEHDEEMLTTLRPLYDAVIEHNPDGGWIPMESERMTTAPTFRSTTPPPGGTASTDPNRPETVPMRHSFDTILELLSSPRRRTLLYKLKNQSLSEIPLDQLIEEIYKIDRSLPSRKESTREEIKIELIHNHLPLLQEREIVRYESESKTVHYMENEGLESVLRYVETIELG